MSNLFPLSAALYLPSFPSFRQKWLACWLLVPETQIPILLSTEIVLLLSKMYESRGCSCSPIKTPTLKFSWTFVLSLIILFYFRFPRSIPRSSVSSTLLSSAFRRPPFCPPSDPVFIHRSLICSNLAHRRLPSTPRIANHPSLSSFVYQKLPVTCSALPYCGDN